MKWISQHKLTFLLIIVALVAGAFYMLSQGSSVPPADISLITTTESTVPGTESGDQQIVATLLALHAVTLSSPILQEPAFATLKDFGTQIVAEPIGRSNPFAPLGAGAASSATTSAPSTPTAPTH
jgi:hypothetical protein